MAKQPSEEFPRQHRVVRGADYQSIYRLGLKLQSERFVLFGRANQLDHHRLGITVSRKVGGAVTRNRIKRWFREIFRKSSADVPNHYDFVVNAKRGCADAKFSDLKRDFLSLARKLCR